MLYFVLPMCIHREIDTVLCPLTCPCTAGGGLGLAIVSVGVLGVLGVVGEVGVIWPLPLVRGESGGILLRGLGAVQGRFLVLCVCVCVCVYVCVCVCVWCAASNSKQD